MENVEKMTCPYNKAHEIIPERFQSHLYKCRENYPLTDKKPCKWNAVHDVPIPEYQYHLRICPDRKKIDTAKFQVGGEAPEKKVAPIVPDIPLPPSSNEWDDVEQPSYLDVKDVLLEKKEVLRIPVGTTKSKKRDFYNHEHSRFDNLRKGEEPEGASGMSFGYGSSKKTPSVPRPPHGVGLGRGRGIVSPPSVKPDPGRGSEVPIISDPFPQLPQPAGEMKGFISDRNASVKRERLSDDENARSEEDDEGEFQIVIRHKGLGRGRRKH